MPTKVIAEIGWNFMGDVALAQRMITGAKAAGADLAKFQYWNPSKLKPGPWDTDGRVDIYRAAALDASKIQMLSSMCVEAGIEFLISAFNASDAKFLADLGVTTLKVPSHEVANEQLHLFASKSFKKIFVSLGAGTETEVEAACAIYNESPNLEWVGMHCVSSYPCSPDQANLPRLNYLRAKCPELGYSDHTRDIITPALSIAFGVSVVEKHFTIDKTLPGRDNKFALDQSELAQMISNIRLAEQCLIDHGSGPRPIEIETMEKYRGRWGD